MSLLLHNQSVGQTLACAIKPCIRLTIFKYYIQPVSWPGTHMFYKTCQLTQHVRVLQNQSNTCMLYTTCQLTQHARVLQNQSISQTLTCSTHVFNQSKQKTKQTKNAFKTTSHLVALSRIRHNQSIRQTLMITRDWTRKTKTKTTELNQEQISGLVLHLIVHHSSPFSCCLSVIL